MKGQIIANWLKQLGIAVPKVISEKEYKKRLSKFDYN